MGTEVDNKVDPWIPLPSNPEILTGLLGKLGVSGDWSVVDVLGFDDELLELVPKPVHALILLFPCTAKYEEYRAAEDEKLKENMPEYPKELFYMKQTVQNACGTCALIHAIVNTDDMTVEDGILKKFLDEARDLTAEERGKLLGQQSEFMAIHNGFAERETAGASTDGEDNHFVTLIEKDGELYELDGRKSCPIKHGPTTSDTFLQDAARVCKEFMARDPDELRFTVGAVVPVAPEV